MGLLKLKSDLRWNVPHFRGNGVLLAIFIVINIIRWLVFGSLTPDEIQILTGKTGYTIWEFVFGQLVFLYSMRQSLTYEVVNNQLLKFAGYFISVLLLKFFHYLSIERSKTIFNSSVRLRNHNHLILRFSIGLLLVNMVDGMLIYRFFYELYHNIETRGNILIAIFGFEILNICPLIIVTTIKFALDYYGMIFQCNNRQWEDRKRKCFQIGEFITNLLRFTMTTIFAIIFLFKFTFPIHILPSSYLTLKVLVIKTRSLVDDIKIDLRLKKFIIPTSLVDIHDDCCIFCLDEFFTINNVKIIPNCDHAFHTQCLRSWMKNSRSCPTCRQPMF